MTCEAVAGGPWITDDIATEFCVCYLDDDHEAPHYCACGASWMSTEAKL